MTRNLLVLTLALAFTSLGCGGDPDRPKNLPTLYPLTVSVNQGGTPVEGAFVRLIPKDAAMPWSCGATTDSSGNAIIKTVGKFKGAPEGDYKVVVSKLETTAVTGMNMSDLNAQPSTQSPGSFDLVDPKYGSQSTTTLEVKVAKDNSKIEFDVGPAVRVNHGPLQ